jgi:hypothetical protein
MLQRLLKIGLLGSFSLAYMEWGKGQHITIGQFQWGFFTGEFAFWQNVTHPLILAGLHGQLILLISVFIKIKNYLVYSSIAMLGAVIFLISLAGALSKNIGMMASVMPF